MWLGYNNYSHFFTMDKIRDFWKEVGHKLPMVKTGKGVEYFNIPASFDIETSSFKDAEGNKHATMYLWGININGSSLIGRTWKEFDRFLHDLNVRYMLNPNSRIMVIYVHNLGYEFQWMRNRIAWVPDRVFSIKERRPVYALSQLGIEFRCSYFLSNYSLAYIGSEMLKKYPVTKKVGLLDYSKVRHSGTILTADEIRYQLDDVRVVASYIQEKIEQDGSILQIPLTNTGYVRRYCRNYCLQNGKKFNYNYRVLMKNLRIESEKEYKQLNDGLMGGFTHANPHYSGKILQNVGSADLTSDYPYQMVADYFPMTGGEFIGRVDNDDEFRKLLKNYCCLFSVKLYNITPRVTFDNYISVSHCDLLSDDYVDQNGRLVTAEYAQLTVTELDWDIIEATYEFEEFEIFNMRIYGRGYLPKELILSILQLYKNKTSLKGVTDKIIEYMVSKNMINAAYGMAVTNIVRNEIQYEENEWSKDVANASSQLKDYNSKFNRFLSYAWGVWVTAHARHCLWEAILEFGNDYVYADTDSIKGINFDNHKAFFTKYNRTVKKKLAKMCMELSIPYEWCEPETIKGEKKLIGLWDMEEGYSVFKTIGAKRYMYINKDGTLGMTVAGVNKHSVLPYMLYMYSGEKYHTDEWLEVFKQAYDQRPEFKDQAKAAMKKVLEEKKNGLNMHQCLLYFTENLYIPPEHTGKQTLTYIDHYDQFSVIDYLGRGRLCEEYSSVYMEQASYSFSMAETYVKYLKQIQDASI